MDLFDLYQNTTATFCLFLIGRVAIVILHGINQSEEASEWLLLSQNLKRTERRSPMERNQNHKENNHA